MQPLEWPERQSYRMLRNAQKGSGLNGDSSICDTFEKKKFQMNLPEFIELFGS